MKRIFRALVALGILISSITPITASAVSANPSPVCSGSTCTVTFAYTGDFYSWTVPYSGTFTLEVWGAQGGNAGYNGTALSAGGKGGYAKGTKSLSSGAVLNIFVGGQGAGQASLSTYDTMTGGFNGGGAGFNGNSTTNNRAAGGGGATDIRLTSNALSDRIIVAGGGGGGALCTCYGTNTPGVGGGTSGGDGTTANYSYTTHSGKGGTQSAGGVGGVNGGTAVTGSLGLGGAGFYGHSYGSSGGGGGYFGGGGAGVGMGSGGGSGYVGGVTNTTLTKGNASMPNPSGGTMTGNTGNGVARITYDNNVYVTTFSSSTSSPTNSSSSITFSIVLSQNASGIANSDFANAGTSTGCTFSISASSGSSFTLTVSNCSEGTLIPKVNANSMYGTVSATNGPAADALTTTPITIDRTAPTISSVAQSTNGRFTAGLSMIFNVKFSESATVNTGSGVPRLTLTIGPLTRYASYLAKTDSQTATFRYVVGNDPDEYDADGVTVLGNLDLNGGSVLDSAGNSLSDNTFTAPNTTLVTVAKKPAAPTIDSITATDSALTVYFHRNQLYASTITNYEYSIDNGANWVVRSPVSVVSPLTITGLTNGQGYPVRIRAFANTGYSDSSTAVTETPTAISVTGDSTLSLTYGNSASTSAYSASGGTNTFTWSLGSSLTGVSLSGTTVTASSSTPAGTYIQTVRATDGNSQVGSKTLTITVAKAPTTISIALPNASTTAAAGGAVTITATVSRAGSVNFKIGGVTISGCGAAAAASTTATCLWSAPGSLGGVTLSADFTPTDSSNFETSTTGSVSITVVDGVTTLTLSLPGGAATAEKGKSVIITANVDQVGRITFMVDGKRIPGCNNLVVSGSTRTCTWKPTVQKNVTITSRIVPTNNIYPATTSALRVQVIKRQGNR